MGTITMARFFVGTSGLLTNSAISKRTTLLLYSPLGFAATGWQVLVAPVGTPEQIIAKISDDLRKVVSDPDFKKSIATRGSYTRAMSPAEAIAFVQAEQRRWKPVLELIANKTK
jgi:hypothetical protein